ncbi:MAG: NAD(P)H-binding protein, partial [Rhodothermaceae bacterium]|nr:NAD(P)H-binding protein [Rhodothermaceae bacterium]
MGAKRVERVLVVGASGVLGREVVSALKQRGGWVRGTSRDGLRVPAEADEAFAADVLDPQPLRAACEGIETVIHAAGASPVSLAFRFDRRGFQGVDTAGTGNLVAAAQEAGVQRFVYVSVAGASELAATPYV